MTTVAKSEITRLLIEWSEGDETAMERLLPKVMEELREIAQRSFDREEQGHTLQPTALVSELYLRLVNRRSVNWKNRAHFFGFAAQSMRRILVDHARRRRAAMRGGDGQRPRALDDLSKSPVVPANTDLLEVHEALEQLEELEPRQAKVAEQRLFAGLTHKEIAEVLGVTERTVKRDWRDARLWLHRELTPEKS